MLRTTQDMSPCKQMALSTAAYAHQRSLNRVGSRVREAEVVGHAQGKLGDVRSGCDRISVDTHDLSAVMCWCAALREAKYGTDWRDVNKRGVWLQRDSQLGLKQA
jgi:hypothetical protein